MKRFNGFAWSGFLLSVAAFLGYFAFFVRFPLTRDFPWPSYILCAIAAVLLVIGLRRGFAADSTRRRKIGATLLFVLGIAIIGFFALFNLVGAKRLPASSRAPRVGDKAPEFTLLDTEGKSVTLAQILAEPLPGSPARPAKGVMLIFYRGYW